MEASDKYVDLLLDNALVEAVHTFQEAIVEACEVGTSYMDVAMQVEVTHMEDKIQEECRDLLMEEYWGNMELKLEASMVQ